MTELQKLATLAAGAALAAADAYAELALAPAPPRSRARRAALAGAVRAARLAADAQARLDAHAFGGGPYGGAD